MVRRQQHNSQNILLTAAEAQRWGFKAGAARDSPSKRQRGRNENPGFSERLCRDYGALFKKSSSPDSFKGRLLSYCFKDEYEKITGEKNQVHTRSLHAEENAFLQIAKYGGDGIKGGNLFTSASSCVLCSKKAYQLGIRHIYYIDPYTDIANSHILSFGKYKNQCPQCHLFYGAIGKAYTCLFTQRIAIKDELKILLDAENAKSEIKPKKE